MDEKSNPPNLIPEQLSETAQDWLNTQLAAEKYHERRLAAREAIRFSQDPKNIRAR
jgi:hypothetical protein